MARRKAGWGEVFVRGAVVVAVTVVSLRWLNARMGPMLFDGAANAIVLDIPPEAPDPLNERESYVPLVWELAGKSPGERVLSDLNFWWRHGDEMTMRYYIPSPGTTDFLPGDAAYQSGFLEDASNPRPLRAQYAGYVEDYLRSVLPMLTPYMHIEWTSSADQARQWREQGVAMVTVFAADNPKAMGWTYGAPNGFPVTDSMLGIDEASHDAYSDVAEIMMNFLDTMIHEDEHRFGLHHIGYYANPDHPGTMRPGLSVLADPRSPRIFIGGQLFPIGVLDLALFTAQNGGAPLPMALEVYDMTNVTAVFPDIYDTNVPLPLVCATSCTLIMGDSDDIIDAADGSMSEGGVWFSANSVTVMPMGLIGELTVIRAGNGDNVIYVSERTTEVQVGQGVDRVDVLVPVSNLTVQDAEGGDGWLRVSPSALGGAILLSSEGQDILLSSGGTNIRIVGGISGSGIAHLELIRDDGTVARISTDDLGSGGLAAWQQAVDELNDVLGYTPTATPPVTPTPVPTDEAIIMATPFPTVDVEPTMTPGPEGGEYLVVGEACYASPEELEVVMATRDALVAWLDARAAGACAGHYTYNRYEAGKGWQLGAGQVWHNLVPEGMTAQQVAAHNDTMIAAYNARVFGERGEVTVVDMCVGADDLHLSASTPATLAQLLNLRNGEGGIGTPPDCLRVR